MLFIEGTIVNQHKNFSRNGLMQNRQYTYAILASKHVDQVVDVFTKAFCRSEPMTHYLHMNEDTYKIFARAITEKAVADQLSVVALDGNKVIACALVEDIADPGFIPDFDPKFEYILNLLEGLGKDFFLEKKFNTGHIAHLFITAVAEDYRKRGLSTQVNFLAMDLVASKGFDFVYCEFTHPFNEKGVLHHLKNQKRLIGSTIYQDFVTKNTKPFVNLDGGANAYLWEVKENSTLRYIKDNKLIQEKL